MVIKFMLFAFFFTFFGFVLGVIQAEKSHKKEILLKRLSSPDEIIKILPSEKGGDHFRVFVKKEGDE